MKGGPEIEVISLCVKEEDWIRYLKLYFQREVADLARLNHENAGKLLGYCNETSPFARILAWRDSLSMKNLEVTIKEHEHFINEQRSIMQSLNKYVNTVKKLVDDCMSSQFSSSLRPHDAVSALGPMYEMHDKNHLPQMQACYNSISELLDFCKSKKNEMNIFVHFYMQKITFVTYIIKDAKLQFPVFREAMVRQDDLFADLKLVLLIGSAM